MGYRNYANTNGFLVAANGTGDFTSINNAISAIIAKGLSVYNLCLTDPSYTENVSFPAGGNIFSLVNSIILGTTTLSFTGQITFNNLSFITNGSNAIHFTGAGVSIASIYNSRIFCTNATGILFDNLSSSLLNLINCGSEIDNSSMTLYSMSSPGALILNNHSSSGITTLASNNSAGTVYFENVNVGFPVSNSGNSSIIVNPGCYFNTSGSNILALTFNGTGVNSFTKSFATSGTAPAISIGAGASVTADQITVSSNNAAAGTNAIIGAGTLVLGLVTFTGSATNISCTVSPLVTEIANLSLNTPLTIQNGGTGVSSLASGAILYGPSSGGVMTTLPIGTTNQILTVVGGVPTWTTYSQAVKFINATYASSTVALTVTYNNGTAGVGATLTNAGAQATFAIDGQTPAVNSRILIKNQASSFQNGVYTVTNAGSNSTNWVITRATDYNTHTQINAGDIVPVEFGTINGSTLWLQTATVVTIGTDAITFQQFSSPPITTTQYDVLVGGSNNTIANVGPGSAGQYLQSAGNAANPVYSTATLPSTASGTGTILRADGTNWSASTTTYPNTNAINTLVYASSANVLSALSTTNSGVLVTDGSGVPSIGTTLPSTVQGNITTVGTVTSGTWNATTIAVNHGGTGQTSLTNHGVLVGAATSGITQLAAGSAGQALLSGGASADPAYSTPTYPSASGSAGQLLRSDGTNNVYSTSTYPNTNAINTLLYASSANVMSALATANSSILVTSAGGIPSLSGTLPFTLPVSTGGTGAVTLTGVLTGNGTSAVTASAVTQYALLVGGASNAIGSIADVAVNQVLVSGGVAANPAYTAYPQISGLGIGASPGSTGGLTFDGSNFMSAYSVGTFTPTLDGSVSGTTTYTTQQGYYVKIGKLVFFNIVINISAATGTGNVTIAGLPFGVAQTSIATANLNTASFAFPVGTTTCDLFLNSATSGIILCYGTITGQQNLQMANASGVFRFSGCYQST
jgi:hypothetical protein